MISCDLVYGGGGELRFMVASDGVNDFFAAFDWRSGVGVTLFGQGHQISLALQRIACVSANL